MQKVEAELHFIPPMECLEVGEVGEGREWLYEIKHDGYRVRAKSFICARPAAAGNMVNGVWAGIRA